MSIMVNRLPSIVLVTLVNILIHGSGINSTGIHYGTANFRIQIGPHRERYWEDSTITEKGEGKCCGKVLKVAGVVEIVCEVRIREPKK